MKSLALALALLAGAVTAADRTGCDSRSQGHLERQGQVRRVWQQSAPSRPADGRRAPRVRDIDVTYVVDGQEGRLAWGRSSSTIAQTNEPFAWAISADNKSIVGADRDGYFHITLIAPDRMDKCYVQSGTSPSGSIVAACYEMRKIK